MEKYKSQAVQQQACQIRVLSSNRDATFLYKTGRRRMYAGIDDATKDARRCSWSMSRVQGLAPQAFAWMNNWSTSSGEGPDSEETYPFGRVVLEEVKGARGSDDSGIVERRRIC